MAEERNLATVRATDATDDTDVTKEELQRRMEEARESITQTVAEIKDTVTNQYQAVKETVTDALDWREQYRRRPVAFSIGALSVGFIVGYSLAGAFKGDDDSYDYEEEVELSTSRATSSQATPASSYYRGESAEGTRTPSTRSYAAQAITGSASHASSDYGAGSSALHEGAASASSPALYSSAAGADEVEEESGPGLIERFKGTKAYDRLEEEVSALGDRFINELSKTAQSVVLPALFSKVKELFGVDLSNKEGGTQQKRSSAGSSAATNASLSGGAQSSFAGGNRGASGREDESTLGSEVGNSSSAGDQSATGGSSYATSENRGYGASAGGGDYTRGSD